MKWYETRFAQYAFYTILYFTFWKLAGFELTAIIALSQIMGEIRFNNQTK